MKPLVVLILFLQLLTASLPGIAESREGFGRPHCPYGGYGTGRQWGWYGARSPVESPEKARAILEEYFKGDPATVGEITGHPLFFKAVILDRQGAVLDVVIVHRATGRIRSIGGRR